MIEHSSNSSNFFQFHYMETLTCEMYQHVVCVMFVLQYSPE